jgi:hypothetical protein
MKGEGGGAQDHQALVERARRVKEKYEQELMAKANVVGVGVGLRQRGGLFGDEVVLVVMVRRKQPRSQLAEEDLVPSELEGIAVDVQEVGEISAHSAAEGP